MSQEKPLFSQMSKGLFYSQHDKAENENKKNEHATPCNQDQEEKPNKTYLEFESCTQLVDSLAKESEEYYAKNPTFTPIHDKTQVFYRILQNF